jgi:hypothetical protein
MAAVMARILASATPGPGSAAQRRKRVEQMDSVEQNTKRKRKVLTVSII